MMQLMTTRRWSIAVLAVLFSTTSLVGCQSLSRTERGAATGAGAGAVIGGVIGAKYGDTAKGAIIGAAVGGVAGAVIGRQMDKQAAELERELEGAEVDRVGEGIAIRFDSGILFDFDSAELRPEARDNLRELARSLQQYPNTDAMIVGHTDSRGSDEYNLGLSQRRAESAAQYLVSQGISRSRLTTLGKGEREPVASNDTDYGRQQNRRVEVAIFASEAYREELTSN